MEDQTAINLYVSRKTGPIVDLAAQGIRSKGLQVGRGLNHPRTYLVIEKGGVRAVWDLGNTIRAIATLPDDTFDSRLTNSSYEMIKTTTVLTQRLQVIFAYFLADTEQERMERLSELTNSANLAIQIYRSPGG